MRKQQGTWQMYREISTQVAWQLLGTPYKWGGNDPLAGFDCSGFCIELLQSVKRFPLKEDTTAKGLWLLFKNCRVSFAQEGCLVFWGDDESSIRHVEYCLNEDLSIGASGGGSNTNSVQDAIDQNAYIKIRPIRSRPGVVGFVDPFMKGI